MGASRAPDPTATVLDWCGLSPSPGVDPRSLLPLVRGENVPWGDAIECELHGRHVPSPRWMLRAGRHKLVVNPESVNELGTVAAGTPRSST